MKQTFAGFSQLEAARAGFVSAWLAQSAGLWTRADTAGAYLDARFGERLELAEPEVCRARHQAFGLPGTQPQDYAERLLSLPGQGRLLAGIRFRNLDPDFPFIELSGDLPLPELLARRTEIFTTLRQTFAVFRPRGLTLCLPAALAVPDARTWNLYLSGTPVAAGSWPDCELRRPARILDQQAYLAHYRRWARLQPVLSTWVGPEAEADLEAALEADLYFRLDVRGQPVGLIAGRAAAYYDREGVYLIEQLVFPEYQGRGYGRILQALFQQAIRTRFDCIWGTIHSENTASLQTALACGRSISEREVFWAF